MAEFFKCGGVIEAVPPLC